MIHPRFKLMLAAFLVTAGSMLSLSVPVFAASPVVADFNSDACGGVTAVAGGSCSGATASSDISRVIKASLNILSAVAGVAAVVVVVISGLRLITANGDSSSVASARSGLIYALAGLVIVAVAQAIVHYVLNRVQHG